jgi:hypothetical protein
MLAQPSWLSIAYSLSKFLWEEAKNLGEVFAQ